MLNFNLHNELQINFSDGWKKTVFLVPSVPLVKQQADFLRANTPFAVRSYCGADGVDGWRQDRWDEEFAKYQVMVMVREN